MRSRSARVGFAFTYSITSVSPPRWSRISRARRDLLHTGLWYTTTSSVMVRRLPLVRLGEGGHGGCSNRLRDQREVTGTRHVDRAERRQVRSRPLHVEEHTTTSAHEIDECDDRDLRRVRHAMELRLS